MPHALSRLAAILLTLTLFACDQRPVGLVPETPDVEWREVVRVPRDRSAVSIWGSGPDDIYLGGRYALRHFDGTSWEPVVLPGFYDRRVWGSGPNDVYAAGTYALHHFDGVSWSDLGRRAEAVDGTSETNVYAMDRTMLSHFDGASWDTVMVARTGSFLRAVSALPEAGAVVVDRDSLVLWDGASLTHHPLPANLYEVWAAAGDDVYALGPGTSGGSAVWHWDGAAWSMVASPGQPALLTAIAGRGPDDVCAVGYGGVVLELKGTSWSEVDRFTQERIEDVWMMANGDAFALSRKEDVFLRSGGSWSVWRETGPLEPRFLFVESRSRLAVADDVYDGGVYFFVDGGWRKKDADFPFSVRALGGTSLDDLHAALTTGRMAHFDGVSWSLGDSLSGYHHDIAAVSRSVAYLVGDRAIHRYNGSSWVLERESEPAYYLRVWAADETVAYAAGSEFVRRDATGWHRVPLPDGRTSYDVWGVAADDVYIAAGNALLHFDGREVSEVPPFEHVEWFAHWIGGTGFTDILVSTGASFYHFDGGRWSSGLYPSPYVNDLVLGVDGSVWVANSVPDNAVVASAFFVRVLR